MDTPAPTPSPDPVPASSQVSTPVATAPEPAATATLPQVDPAAIEAFIAQKRARQSLPLGLIAGIVAAIVGAALWAAITVTTQFQIGWMAVGVGFLVGFAIRIGGRGIDPIFGYLGAVLALVGCLAGNLFSAVGFVAQHESIPFFDLLGALDLDAAMELLSLTFSPMDLLFYGIAVYEGYRFSFMPISDAELNSLAQGRA